MSEENMSLTRPNRLTFELVFADGIGSSGKGMLSHILSCFDRVEKQSNHTVFDFVPYIHYLGKISNDAAITYLQTEADMQLYHIMISRDVNFRPKDSTGVLRNAKRFQYFKRLFLKEGDSVVNRILNERPILNEAPHDALRSSSLFFKSFGDGLKIIYVIREPFELILDWKRRGFGSRIGVDPREFQFNLQIKENIVPMFMKEYDVNYHELTELERILYMIHFCFRSNLNGYKSISNDFKKNVFITTFESLCINPRGNIDSISKFLNLSISNGVDRILKQENLPRRFKADHAKDNENAVVQGVRENHHWIIHELKLLYNEFLTFKSVVQ